MQYLIEIWRLTTQMSPYLLFGFLVAGILSVLLSAEWVEKHLGRGRWGPIIKAALFGVPLPLCSCSVIPVGVSLRKHGASRGATIAFLLSTPQTGVDSILATWGMLGPLMGVFRPLVAFVTGLLGGGLVSALTAPEESSPPPSAPASSCGHCCGEKKKGAAVWGRALRHAFLTLPQDIALSLALGIGVAGALGVLIQPGALGPYLGGGIGAMGLMLLVGLPLYVCSTASIPIALGFVHMGASPGAALAFLIAGPATNAATVAVVWRLLGRRTAILYLATVACGAVLAGMGMDALALAWPEVSGAHQHGGEGLAWWEHLSGAVLLLLLGVGALRGLRGRIGRTETQDTPPRAECC